MIYQVWVDSEVANEFLNEQAAEFFATFLIESTLDTCVAITSFQL